MTRALKTHGIGQEYSEMLRDEPHLRRLILLGTPVLTGTLLLFHPLPEGADMSTASLPRGLALYELLAPIARPFLVVHLLFPAALALLALSAILLLDGVRSVAASISRISAFVFAVSYILYETIIGTVSGLLVHGAAGLSRDEQAAIGDAIYRNFTDPLAGDLPSAISITAWLTWMTTVALGAYALRRSGRALLPCVLLALSFVFVSHASMLGPAGLLLFFLAAAGIERSRSIALSSVQETALSLQ
jgi:hypothetical protein